LVQLLSLVYSILRGGDIWSLEEQVLVPALSVRP
jgi:hypothetical protein